MRRTRSRGRAEEDAALAAAEARFAARLAAAAPRRERAAVAERRAAVLVPLFASPIDGELRVVLTKRSSKLRTHAGQVAFPGGKRDAGESDEQTALREAQEEVGLEARHVRGILGHLPPRLSAHKLSVAAVVAEVEPGFLAEARLCETEVDAVFDVPLRRFYVPRPETRYAHRDIDWGDTGQFRLRLHEFAHGCERSGETYVIWGLTAHVCAEVAAIIYGGADTGGEAVKVVLDPPGGPRFVDIHWCDGVAVHVPEELAEQKP